MSTVKQLESVKNNINILQNHFTRQLNSYIYMIGVEAEDYCLVNREVQDYFETIKETIDIHIAKAQDKTKLKYYFKALLNIFAKKQKPIPVFSIMYENNLVVTLDKKGKKIKSLSGYYDEMIHAKLLSFDINTMVNFPELKINKESVEQN